MYIITEKLLKSFLTRFNSNVIYLKTYKGGQEITQI